ncbi:unnamed protein product [Discula destructiva]
MDTIVTGTAFGSSLVASSMYQPDLVAAQFTLQNWDFAQTFLTAIASSALAIELLRQLNYSVPSPRTWSPTGLLPSAIDGNILGGLLLGTGMALSLACPGMGLPQLALRLPSAPASVAGSCLGGLVWSGFLRPWIARQRQRRTTSRSKSPSPPPPVSVAQALGVHRAAAFLLFEAVLVAGVVVAAVVRPLWTSTAAAPVVVDPVVGGLLIGGAQLVSMVLRRGALLGVSTGYEQLGDWVVFFFLAKSARRPGVVKPGTSAMLFSVAMVGGAWAVRVGRPELAPVLGAGNEIGTARALAGGFAMAVGSRMAGGCASGHGISGLALMSLSSLVTMAATFAAAVGVSMYVL